MKDMPTKQKKKIKLLKKSPTGYLTELISSKKQLSMRSYLRNIKELKLNGLIAY